MLATIEPHWSYTSEKKREEEGEWGGGGGWYLKHEKNKEQN